LARSSTQPALSEEMLIEAALGIIRRKGVAGLTMRDLADTLGVSPMAAYYHVNNKDDLLRLVGNHVWGSLEVPPPGAGPWYERLRTAMTAERHAVEPYRGLYEAVTYLDVDHKRALEDAVLDLMLDAGFPPDRAVLAFRALMSWVTGYFSLESAFRDPKRRRPPSRWGKARRLAHDREQVPEMQAKEYFVFGLDSIIAGLRTTLEG
jgi:AcrR family transcriptional regulator